jgi:hypothetical protein
MSIGKPRDRSKENAWRRRLRDWQRSGLSVSAFCRRYGRGVSGRSGNDLSQTHKKQGVATRHSFPPVDARWAMVESAEAPAELAVTEPGNCGRSAAASPASAPPTGRILACNGALGPIALAKRMICTHGLTGGGPTGRCLGFEPSSIERERS